MSRPIEKPAEFFVDRSLGKSIVEGLRDAGLTVHSMADIYGERRAQLLADEVWLRAEAARPGLVRLFARGTELERGMPFGAGPWTERGILALTQGHARPVPLRVP